MSSTAPEIWQNAHNQAPSSAEGLTLPGTWEGNVRKTRINMGGISPARAHRAIEQTRQQGGHIVAAQYSNGIQVHTALEPHCAVARWLDETHLEVYMSTQAVAAMRKDIAKHFDLPMENVTVIAQHVGGGFGAKNYLFDEALAAVKLAKLAQAPVAVIPTRAEEMNLGGMRPGGRFEVQLAAETNGNLAALVAHAYNDNGVAVGNISSGMTGMGYAGGARDLRDYDVVSNHAPGKPFRGPGGPGAMWAMEQAVDQLAHDSQMDVLALRRKWTKNELRLKLYDWVEELDVWRNRQASGAQTERFRRGVGVAFGHWLYIYEPETEIEVGSTAVSLTVSTSTQDIGNGVRTTLARTVADVFGLATDAVDVAIGNSGYPHGPRAGGSRVTVSVYEPTERAATLLRDRLFGLAAEEFDLAEAEIVPGGIQHRGGQLGWLEILPKLPPQKATVQRGADPRITQRIGTRLTGLMGMDMMVGSGMAQGAVVVEVEVDALLGKTRVLRVWQNLAIGRTYYPDMARSQVYGAVIQGIGYALYEEKLFDKTTGANLTRNLQDYRIPGIGDMPEIEAVFTDGGFEHVKGKGVGMSELSTMPVAAAVANAVFNATGWRPLESPITPERLVAGLQEGQAS
jgi:xanthine dehydrogenase YagR molybdenum-binding subunit